MFCTKNLCTCVLGSFEGIKCLLRHPVLAEFLFNFSIFIDFIIHGQYFEKLLLLFQRGFAINLVI